MGFEQQRCHPTPRSLGSDRSSFHVSRTCATAGRSLTRAFAPTRWIRSTSRTSSLVFPCTFHGRRTKLHVSRSRRLIDTAISEISDCNRRITEAKERYRSVLEKEAKYNQD